MQAKTARRIRDSSFTIVANGYDAAPHGALREYLIAQGAHRVTTIYHPLACDSDSRHEITAVERGTHAHRRTVRLPCRVPWTYPLDLLVPPWPERADVWFGFNNLACLRGLAARRLGRVDTTVYWCVDYTPDRFGATLVTRAFDRVDRYCCRHADARFELSHAAQAARDQRLALDGDAAPTAIAPMGAWLDRVQATSKDGWRQRRLVFSGHLVPRQGVEMLLDAFRLLADRGLEFQVDIAGRGPLESQLRKRTNAAGLGDAVRFHGFISDHRELETLLASASVALAPYDTTIESFTRYADPAKLKTYLAAGLPILMTDVPPNAHELAREGGAELVTFVPEEFANAIERLLSSPDEWRRRRAAALRFIQSYDWSLIMGGVLERLGFQS